MNTIEKMAEEVRKAIYTLEQGKPCKAICEEMRQKLDTALTAYESEKGMSITIPKIVFDGLVRDRKELRKIRGSNYDND